ncbi:GDA1/CD39 family protein [Truncatella angustata]|uniref:GDA1/CD39 family protein n=1 Tax=Truncatella angustata TaxID=152316 RepID=A0A9P9A410_9PEZI|nr:GDA1/CD39 family protein [Truncatella angustata]KAH6660678.1 GDA1/CD39 family protein [Truncatella angustata]KAH8194924.1 hypothetical protein TruAng_010909 [Truncatella angustata]
MGKSKWRWGVIFDAGSSGTRLHIYRWEDPAKAIKDADDEDLASLPKVETKKKWTEKIRPGISSFGEHPEDVGDYMKDLVEKAVATIPEEKHADTPIFLMATAGMRLLPPLQQRAVLSNLCTYFRQNTRFSLPDCDRHIQVIPGETEGLYGWIAANYLLGGFDDPEGHAHGKDHHTYGFLDMGGASAQIAFAPNSTEAEKHADDLKLLRMRTMNGASSEYKVFTTTWLGFGVHQARQRYVQKLVDTYLIDKEHEVPDPCMPRGLRTTEDGELIKGVSNKLELVGTGDFPGCLKMTRPLLGKDAPCEDEPCLLNGQHVPGIDFDVNHFVGVSEYWHTTHGVFEEKGEKAYDYNTYQKKVEEFCSQSWTDIAPVGSRKKDHSKDAQEACFKASWLINVLHEGIGVPRIGIENTPTPDINITKGIGEAAKDKGFLEPFQAVDKIDDIEVSWTLGPMVLYAAGQVPPIDGSEKHPVGFGSNVKGIPKDFQYAGSNWTALSTIGNEDWDDLADDLVDHVKRKSGSGFALFILIIIFIGYIFRRKDRRMRVYGKINSLFRRHQRRPGSPRAKSNRGLAALTGKIFGRNSHNYERVVEEGDAAEFELGDVESDEGEHSDSSGGTRQGRTSGLATPKLNVMGSFDDLTKSTHPASALDRSGLVVRTESRERLTPHMLHAGRRSRACSPTRIKSPLMSPLNED